MSGHNGGYVKRNMIQAKAWKVFVEQKPKAIVSVLKEQGEMASHRKWKLDDKKEQVKQLL